MRKKDFRKQEKGNEILEKGKIKKLRPFPRDGVEPPT